MELEVSVNLDRSETQTHLEFGVEPRGLEGPTRDLVAVNQLTGETAFDQQRASLHQVVDLE